MSETIHHESLSVFNQNCHITPTRQVVGHEYLINFIVSHDLSTAIFFSGWEQKIFMFVVVIIPSAVGQTNLGQLQYLTSTESRIE